MARGERKRKLVSFDIGVLAALNELSREGGDRLDDMMDEALRAYLKKRGQPTSFKEALELSARTKAANDAAPKKRAKAKKHKGV